ncbi:MAG TPA: chloride channel protein [Prolixibacteraceae bacterium]|nr:chloride channel protein [Prolixibacteraceae bacterium]
MTFLQKKLEDFQLWRINKISTKNFVLILSVLIGILSGFVAVIIKNAVKFLHQLLKISFFDDVNYLFFLYPIIGLSLTVIFIKYILKKPVRHGIPNVLYGISKRKGFISRHNTYSSIITSAFTVGFGGSVGLEGPTVSTGAAIGSQLSKFFRLEYKYVILLLSCASAASMAAIFKAPIAGIVFAVEVIMIDLTTFSMIPLLLASASAVLTSYLFLGMDVLYPFEVKTNFELTQFPIYIVLGISTGLVSAYFIKTYVGIARLFSAIKLRRYRLIFGGTLLGVLIFIFPSLFGEGYEAINSGLSGDTSYLFTNSLFASSSNNLVMIFLLLGLVILTKIVATSLTFGAGGVGGIFAPALFTGVNTGLFLGFLLKNVMGFNIDVDNFALLGMSGILAGVLHAPLTGIFLIADISGGYKLFVPLMITATFSYLTVKIFTKNSVYTEQLVQQKQLITHHKDKQVLSIMQVPELIENDFKILHKNDKLRQLVEAISVSHRDLYPIVDNNGTMVGMLKLDDVRHLIFKQEVYDKIKLTELMYMPEHWISPHDSMDEVVDKFESSGRFNLAVIDKGKYIGFISRAKVFSNYRDYVKMFSSD